MVAAQPVNAALRRIGKNAFFQASLSNFLRDVLFSRERLARSFVLDELDAKKQSETAHLADVRMGLQERKRASEFLPGGIHAIKKFVRFEIIEHGVARSCGHWMSLIREAVQETAGAALEGFDDASGSKDSAERSVTAGDSFAYQNHIRLNAPVLHGERFPRAAHARHYFVGDQQNSVLAADFCDARGVALRRHSAAKRRANNRLEDKRRSLISRLPA